MKYDERVAALVHTRIPVLSADSIRSDALMSWLRVNLERQTLDSSMGGVNEINLRQTRVVMQ